MAEQAAAVAIQLAITYAVNRVFGPKPQSSDSTTAPTVITVNYGDPIPWFTGTARIAPQVWWSSAPRARTTTSGGKGGGQTTTSTTYVRDVLFGLTANEAGTVARIWRNGDLVWTSLPDASITSINNSLQSDQWSRLTIYPGDSNQLPDPTIESAMGVGNVPAYRDRCSVFFQDLNCGTAGTLDNWTMEVVQTEFGHLVFSAPMTTDANDTVAPTATIVSTPTLAGTFSSSGVNLLMNTYAQFYAYVQDKLNFDSYGALYQVQMDVSFTFVATTGDGDSIRLLNIGSGTTEKGFSFRTIGGQPYLQLYSYTPDNYVTTVLTYAPPNGRYRLIINTAGSTSGWYVAWEVNGVVLRTDYTVYIPHGRVWYGIANGDGRGLQSVTMKNCNVLATGTSAYDGSVTLQSVVESLCARAQMPSGTYDASALSTITKPVRSLVLSQVAATRTALETLRSAFFFDASVSDKLYFRPRATTATLTIGLDDLAAGQEVASGEPLAIKQSSDLELPQQVSLTYQNITKDYQAGTELSDRLGRGQVALSTVDLALGMKPTEAKAVADALVIDGYTQQTTGQISVPLYYAALEPGDVVNIDGQAFRLGRKQDSQGVLQFEISRHDSSAIVSAGLTDTSYTPAADVIKNSATDWQLLDMPMVRDADDGPGYLVAARGQGTQWPGASILSSLDNVSFASVASIAERAVFGLCTTTLPNYSGVGMDTVNTVTVNVGAGQLSSTTRDGLLADEKVNTILIGSELVRFVTATATGTNPNVYTLSGLIRGCRGTEWAMAGHASSERCVLITSAGLRFVATQSTDVGATRYIKGVTLGAAISSVTAVAFANTGINQKCLAPVNIRLTTGSGGPTISWTRRTRYSTKFVGASGSVYPVGESSERYTVRIYADSGYTTLVRTLSATSQSAQYASDDLQSDLPAYSSGTLYVDVRQINGQGNEGYQGRAMLQATEADTASGPAAGFVSSFGPRIIGTFAGSLIAHDIGSTSLGGESRLLVSSDDGASFTNAVQSLYPFNRVYGNFGLDALGSKRLSVTWNYDSNFMASYVAADNATAPTITNPAPLISGQYIFPGALGVDGSNFVLIGTPKQAGSSLAVDPTKLYLYRSSNGTAWSLDGQANAAGTDPNALTGLFAFTAYAFLGQSVVTPQGTLQKIGSRWFYLTSYTLHYTDDATMLTGWKRCPTGLGEGAAWPYILLGNLIQFGSYLVLSRVGASGNSLAYSSDNGSTWTAIRPTAQGNRSLTYVYAHGSTLVALVSGPDQVFYALTASTPTGTFTSTRTNGFGVPAENLVRVSGSNAVAASSIGGLVTLKYSADSITWQPSIVS